MIFDPFKDFKEAGYLRNTAGEKDLEKVKVLEHRLFLATINKACQNLAEKEWLSYQDVLETHKIFFESLYPWAGQDRSQTAPNLAVSKGSVLFAHPDDLQKAVEHALRLGQHKATMTAWPGEVMSFLAYGHPFLDGNGRTIMAVHVELAHRAGIRIDWSQTNKVEYLTALTKELNDPGKAHLDNYLAPFVSRADSSQSLANQLISIQGLDGRKQSAEQNEVLGSVDSPVLKARYEQQEEQRRQAYTQESIQPETTG